MRRLFIPIFSSALLFGTTQLARAEIQPQRFDGGRVSIDTSTGARCSASGADRSSASFIAGHRDNDQRAAVIVSIPLGGQRQGNCNSLLEHEEARSRLGLAAQLFEAGALTPEQFKAIADEISLLIK